ncbi:HSD17B6 [Branchiostoma lanceolatum]|uniref:HSD17B6 protein n=1 Tax=Branchiostoma lanceolatum TaxID=7740 RepID=A0A8K0EL02_BRALA|nr:HSD17B6 [Branchiostoma lanceolatum]
MPLYPGNMEVFTLLEVIAVLWVTYSVITWWLERGRLSQLTDKTVLITGCDTGYGNLLARRLDQLGLRVFAGCLTEAGVAELRQSCSERLQPIQIRQRTRCVQGGEGSSKDDGEAPSYLMTPEYPVIAVDAMEHALCATHPRSRYVIGWLARFIAVPISWLPTDLGDLAIRLVAPLPTPACCKGQQ